MILAYIALLILFIAEIPALIIKLTLSVPSRFSAEKKFFRYFIATLVFMLEREIWSFFFFFFFLYRERERIELFSRTMKGKGKGT